MVKANNHTMDSYMDHSRLHFLHGLIAPGIAPTSNLASDIWKLLMSDIWEIYADHGAVFVIFLVAFVAFLSYSFVKAMVGLYWVMKGFLDYLASTNHDIAEFSEGIQVPLIRSAHPTSKKLTTIFRKFKSKPFDKFTCFSNLPPELRLRIWKEANNHLHRIHLFYEDGFVYQKPFLNPAWIVNKEAYYESLRLNPYLSITTSEGFIEKIRFNSEADTLIFTPYTFDTEGSAEMIQVLCQILSNQKEFEKIKSVGVDISKAESETTIAGAYKFLPNLSRITLYEKNISPENWKMLTSPDGELHLDVGRRKIFDTYKRVLSQKVESGMWEGERPEIFFAVVGPAKSKWRRWLS